MHAGAGNAGNLDEVRDASCGMLPLLVIGGILAARVISVLRFSARLGMRTDGCRKDGIGGAPDPPSDVSVLQDALAPSVQLGVEVMHSFGRAGCPA